MAGIVRTWSAGRVDELALRRMARALRHRGPDGFGLAMEAGAGFVSTRLAIVDLPGGWQPMRAGGDSLILFNGEVYNHPELRAELRRYGVPFETQSDTEVVLRLLEREGPTACERFNGQFVLAWWEPEQRRLTLVRDRFGVRPLHWTMLFDGTLVFGSEAKALFASGEVAAEPDACGLDEVFTLWAPRAPRTAFEGIRQLRPGHLLVWQRGRIVEDRPWWRPSYDLRDEAPPPLEPLLRDSVRLRLRADVPVGTYLSGGLDSSLITALARDAADHQLHTFSVAFRDRHYDERSYQEQVAAALGTAHHVVEVGPAEIAAGLPTVIWHTESPLVRTAPVPMWALAREAREWGITVVASGEGADELYWGYDLFKEVRLRALTADDAGFDRRAELLEALYPYLGTATTRRGPAWQRFFLEAGSPEDPLFSHQTRAAATGAVKSFYRDEVAERLSEHDALQRLRGDLPEAFPDWSRLERASYLELTTLLEPYLLAAQGDRVAMAHGVEARYPFLDLRVFDHSVRTPAGRKLGDVEEKVELRDLARTVLPQEIAERPKQPYRAPDIAPFFAGPAPDWVEERLSPAALQEAGMFDERRVSGLLKRCRAGRATGTREGMAVVGILSTQLWHEQFCGSARTGYTAETGEPQVFLNAERATTRLPLMTDTQQSDAWIRRELRAFIGDNFLYLRPELTLDDDDRLLELRVVDSLGYVELVEEVQTRYGVTVKDSEITEENFGSIRAIAAFVQRKQPR